MPHRLVKRYEPPAKRRKILSAASRFEEQTALLNRIAQRMKNTPVLNDACAAFGTVVAGYLRKMTVVQRGECQAAVMRVIMTHLPK